MRQSRVFQVCALAALSVSSAFAQLTITGSLPAATVGVAFQAQLGATGGTPPYHFEAPPGSNANWVSITDSGLLSGTPPNSGAFSISVDAIDSAPAHAVGTRSFILSVAPAPAGPLVWSTTSLPNAVRGSNYNAPLQASGGTPPYNFYGSSLPSGFQVGLGGSVTSEPVSASVGSYTFSLNVQDSSNPLKSAQRSFTISVTAGLIYNGDDFPDGTVGQAYSAQTHVSEGTAPFTFAVVSGSLPPGLGLSSSTGVLSGTPTLVGDYAFGVRVTDSTGTSGTSTAFMSVTGAPITISGSVQAVARVGEAISPSTFTISGGQAPYTMSLQSGPPGLTINSASKTLSGTPTEGGSHILSLTATDQNGSSGGFSRIITVLDLQALGLEQGTVGQSFGATFVGLGFGVQPTFTRTGTLPPGLTLSSGGNLSGTPTTAGTYNFTIQASGGSLSMSRNYSLVIVSAGQPPINVGPPTLLNGTQTVPYSANLNAVGGTPPYTFTKTGGTLPPGLSVSSSGLVSGTPTNSGSYSFEVTARDSTGRTGTGDINIFVTSPPVILQPSSIPNGTVGQTYTVQFSSTGGNGTYYYNASQSIPGVKMNSLTGLFTGVPTLGGTYPVTITVESGQALASRDYTVTISGTGNALSLSPGGLPNGIVGLPYSEAVYINAVVSPPISGAVSWAVSNGSLPPGISEDTSLGDRIRLIGAPTTAGTYSFRITGTDSLGRTGVGNYSITVAAPQIQINPSSLPNGTVGVPYSASFTASGGTPPYSFTASHNTGDFGLSLWFSNGTLQLTPSAAGTGGFLVNVTDSLGVSSSRAYSVTFNASTITVNPSGVPNGVLGTPYSVALSATGGTGPYSFSLSSGALPSGMSVSSAGVVGGTPGQAGNFTFGVTAQAANGASGSRSYQFSVQGATITLGPSTLPDATEGQSYATQLTASGGTAPYTFTRPGGTWNAGLSMSSSGSISGTPQGSGGTLEFTIVVTDANGSTATRAFQIKILSSSSTVLSLTPAVLASATAGQPYSASMSAAGGLPPYVFSVGAATPLPAGLTLSSDGTISGSPTTAGGAIFTIDVTDTNGAKGSRTVQMLILAAVITVGPGSVPDATFNQAYQTKFTASGGTGPYNFELLSGSLPAGLELLGDGTLRGTPTVNSNANFPITIRARDVNGAIGSAQFVLRLLSSGTVSITINPATLPDGTAGSPYSANLTAAGGRAPHTFSMAAGSALPAGINMSEEGAMTGATNLTGTFTFTIRAEDADHIPGTRQYTLHIAERPTSNTLTFEPPLLTFETLAGGTASQQKCVSVFATQTTASANAVIVLQGGPGQAWASLASNALQTPGNFCVNVSATGLPAGNYSGYLNVTSVGVQPGSWSIPLSLVIQPAIPGLLEVAPGLLKVSVVRGGSSGFRSLSVSNDGSGALEYTVDQPAVAWLKAPLTGSVPAASYNTLPLEFDPNTLEAGVYGTDLTLRANGKQNRVSIELSVSEVPGLLSLSQTAVEFVAWTGGASSTTTVGLVNQGSVSIAPVVTSGTTDGKPWLLANVAGGSLAAGAARPIEVTVNPGTLAPGRYTGWIAATGPGVGNGSQVATVGLSVLSAGSALPPEVPIQGMALTPASPQGSILLSLAPGGSLTFTTAISGATGNWLRVTPGQGTVPATGALQLTVNADASKVSAGLYAATVGIGFSDGTARSVPVEFFVPTLASDAPARGAAVVCGTSMPFVAHLLSPTPNFFAKVGRAMPLKLQAENCDGTPASDLEVTAEYGGQSLVLLPESAGVWSASWVPKDAAALIQLRVTATKRSSGQRATFNLAASGSVAAATVVEPIVSAVVNGADPVLNAPVAPGSWITLYGSNLSIQTATGTATPLPSLFGGVQVSVGDLAMPLYYVSPGQVNGLLPKALSPGVAYQLVLRRDGIPSVPVSITVAEVHAGLFTLNQQGNGQAAAVLAGTVSLAAPAAPVARGGVVEVYATGLGAVQNGPLDGAVTSGPLLSPAVNEPTVSVGGRPARVLFAGLTPGSIGLYQINVEIPNDAPVGDAVPVVVTQKGVASNAATIAIR